MRSTPPLTKISVSLRLFENEGRSGRHRFKKWPIPSSLGSAIAVAKWPKSAPDEAILSALLCLGRGGCERGREANCPPRSRSKDSPRSFARADSTKYDTAERRDLAKAQSRLGCFCCTQNSSFAHRKGPEVHALVRAHSVQVIHVWWGHRQEGDSCT